MKNSHVLLCVGAVLIAAVAVNQYKGHVEEVAKSERIAKRRAEHAAKQAELAKPLTQEQQEEKRHAEQFAALDAAQAEEDRAAAETRAANVCREDPTCWSKPFLLDAQARCTKKIESLARYQYEWTDGFGEHQFTDPVWMTDKHNTIVLAGHAIKMQNGFGAWSKETYLCKYDPATRTAEAAIVDK